MDAFRRRGVGRTLLDEAIERSPTLEITALTGLIFVHNEASLQLVVRAGFVTGAFCRGWRDWMASSVTS